MKKNQNIEISPPLLGDDFPEIEAQTTQGMMKIPNDFKGKWFILFSHPSDFTPVCTTEFVSFQKNYEKFKELDCELIGLSVDQIFSHIKWIEWIKDNLDVEIEFPIIADTGDIANKLCIIHPSKGSSTVRSVFVVDSNGKIRTIIYYPQELGRNMNEILRVVKSLKIGDENSVAMPANWPNNEIINDEVIIPPVPNMEAIKGLDKRAKEEKFTCYDWWFCHKKL